MPNSAASARVAAHDALFARELAAVPEDRWRWAHDGDCLERPLDSSDSSPRPLFSVLFNQGHAERGRGGPTEPGPRRRSPGGGRVQPAGEDGGGAHSRDHGWARGAGGHGAHGGSPRALGLGIRSAEVVNNYDPLLTMYAIRSMHPTRI
ncbi:hypothetical protein C2845_PM10G03400 [Panicum miliaceum]|uniref:Uncharacterized protein n=1 Tax=Panicum miliaceum TaxID=4540 RepID=A0A3L6PGS5_PANMI|nr:hypothetical protein C2845_PM10G03400 [Panicum miliaceum]